MTVKFFKLNNRWCFKHLGKICFIERHASIVFDLLSDLVNKTEVYIKFKYNDWEYHTKLYIFAGNNNKLYYGNEVAKLLKMLWLNKHVTNFPDFVTTLPDFIESYTPIAIIDIW